MSKFKYILDSFAAGNKAVTLEVEKNEGKLFNPFASISVSPSGSTSVASVVTVTDHLQDMKKKVEYRFYFKSLSGANSNYSATLVVDPSLVSQSVSQALANGVPLLGSGSASANFLPPFNGSSSVRDRNCYIVTAVTKGGVYTVEAMSSLRGSYVELNSPGLLSSALYGGLAQPTLI